MKGRISDTKWLRVGSPAIVHHTLEHPSAYGTYRGGGEGWLVVDRASQCLVSVHGPFPTRAAAREDVRRIKAERGKLAAARSRRPR